MRVVQSATHHIYPLVVLITDNHTSSSSSSRVAAAVAVWWEAFVAVAHVLGNVRREENRGDSRRSKQNAYGIKGDDPKGTPACT